MNLKELGQLSLKAFLAQLDKCKNIASDLLQIKKIRDKKPPEKLDDKSE